MIHGMTLSLRGQLATLDKDLVWHSEFRALQASLNRVYTRAWWEERRERRMAAREPAYELAHMALDELGGEMVSEPDDWGMSEIPPDATR